MRRRLREEPELLRRTLHASIGKARDAIRLDVSSAGRLVAPLARPIR